MRIAAAVLGAFFVLQSTWILHAGFDVLFPRVAKAVAPDACCASACGCPADVRARGACCCDPAKTVKSPTSPVSAFDVVRCSGLDLAMAHASSTPSVAAFPFWEIPTSSEGELVSVVSTPPHEARSKAVDKVPL